MTKIFQKDIILTILLTVLSITGILSSALNKFPALIFPTLIVPCALLLFFLLGYAFITALYPHLKLIKKFVISLIICASIILSFHSILDYIKIQSTTLLLIIATLTILLALIAYIQKYRGSKVTNRYLVCEKCNGYYKLEEGESLKNFQACDCGGKLKYSENYIRPDDTKKKKLSAKTHLPIIIFLVSLCMIFVFIPSLSITPIKTILISLLTFFLPGYSLIRAIYPTNPDWGKIKIILLSVISSALITFLGGSILSSKLIKAPSITLIIVLAVFTVLMTIISYIKLWKSSKDKDNLNEEPSKTPYEPIKAKKLEKSDDYLKTKKIPVKSRYFPVDIALVILFTVLCIIFVVTPQLNNTVFRIILGLLLILFLPGYSLIASLFPKKDDLDGIERIALSFGLSIAVTPLIGLVLNYTPFGIKLTPILISLSIFTILLSIIACIRRLKLPDDERFKVEFRKHFKNISKSFKKESKTDKVLSLLLIASIILAISATIYIIVTPKEGEKFTEFYILGPNGKASDYPTNLTAGQTGNVTIGIINHEYTKVNYKMVIKLNNNTLKEENITLSNNEKWEKPFTFGASQVGEKQKLEFLLYKLPDNSTVYRSLHLWIYVK